ncbi:MAG: hypothetical protein ABSG51_08745 [Terracidiphilus sp.]|jgi:hypothetical protein
MNRKDLNIKAGDRVIISRPTSIDRYAARVDRFSVVTAVRPTSFDAGGLCFRYDGREWKGHNRIRLVLSEDAREEAVSLAAVEETSRTERAKEDAMLAFLLSSRQEQDWLNLGLEELRRIAALHGIMAALAEPLEALNVDGND